MSVTVLVSGKRHADTETYLKRRIRERGFFWFLAVLHETVYPATEVKSEVSELRLNWGLGGQNGDLRHCSRKIFKI